MNLFPHLAQCGEGVYHIGGAAKGGGIGHILRRGAFF